jgi:hypothetical protein
MGKRESVEGMQRKLPRAMRRAPDLRVFFQQDRPQAE